MAIVVFPETCLSLDVHGAVGYGRGFGAREYGKFRFGGSMPYAGIYSRKVYGQGVTFKPSKRGNRWAISRMRFYRPTNTQQPAQQAWRGVFADAISTWQGLTDEQRASYSKKASGRRMSGYNLFISHWLQSRRT